MLTEGASGFTVLGPDYFFGTSILDVPEDHDKFAWIEEARAPANEAFPKWLDAVKEKYGMQPALGNVPFHPSKMFTVVCSSY